MSFFRKNLKSDVKTGLVCHWKFDENDGNIAFDSSGNGNHGTLIANPVRENGVIGKGIRLNGSSQYATISPFYSAISEWTNSVWMFIDPTTPAYAVIFKCGLHAFQITTTEGNAIRYYDGTTSLDFASQVVFNRWMHITITKKDSLLSLFKNGNFIGSAASSASQPPISLIGYYSDVTHFWDGIIDDARIYNRAITQQEINILYSQGKHKLI